MEEEARVINRKGSSQRTPARSIRTFSFAPEQQVTQMENRGRLQNAASRLILMYFQTKYKKIKNERAKVDSLSIFHFLITPL